MRSRFLHFADAGSEFEDAEFVILGVPFDATSSFRSGSRLAPNAIREASYNFETYIKEFDVDLESVPIFDAGNMEEYGTVDEMVEDVTREVKKILEKGAIPVVLGGEHSVSPGVVKAYKDMGKDIGVMVIDAHLDFRDDYLGVRNSHACATRRMAEIVGVENVAVIGVRSMCKEEREDAKRMGLLYFTDEDLQERKFPEIVSEALAHLGKERIYLTIDADGLDPSIAPGVGNPEPFGLTGWHLRTLLKMLPGSMCGFDFVEVCPPVDNGNTSALAAKVIRQLMAGLHSNRDQG